LISCGKEPSVVADLHGYEEGYDDR